MHKAATFDVDRRPSNRGTKIVECGNSLLWILEVPGLGIVSIRATSEREDERGRMVYEGLASATGEANFD